MQIREPNLGQIQISVTVKIFVTCDDVITPHTALNS